MAISFVKQQAMNTMAGKGSRDNIALDKICFRAINKYINSQDEAKSILNSIKKEGLIEPITVNEISSFLECDDVNLLPAKEREYYLEKQKEGFEYFITTGHRRFRAVCCLAIGIEEFPEDEKEFYEKFRSVKKQSEEALLEGNPELANKYCSIRCFVANDNVKTERERYNSSNLEQRRIQDFEIVDNVIDDLKITGKWDEFIEENKNRKIDSMSDRAVRDNLQKMNKTQYKTMEEARKLLKEIPAELITGYNSELNNAIIKYVQETKSKKLSKASVNFARKILETFDEEMISLIYSGKLEYKKAITMLSYYSEIDEDGLRRMKDSIKKRTFNYRTAERDYVPKKTEGVLKKESDEITTKKNLSKKELVKLIYEVQKQNITIDQLVKMIEG